jgi:hypothetical protein
MSIYQHLISQTIGLRPLGFRVLVSSITEKEICAPSRETVSGQPRLPVGRLTLLARLRTRSEARLGHETPDVFVTLLDQESRQAAAQFLAVAQGNQDKRRMHMKFRRYGAIPVLMAMLALPAVAQFEISPDHLDGRPAENPRISNPRRHAEIERQLATQQARLTTYRKQIAAQVALVEEARQMSISPAENIDKAGANIALQACHRALEASRRSLGGPIRQAEATIAALEKERNALVASVR